MASKSVATKTVPTKAKAAPPKDSDTPEKDGPETPDAPLPLLDLSDAAVKKMIKSAKKRGYVTYEQLNAVMPSEEVTSEKIEDILAMMNEMGINVVENEEAEADGEEGEEAEEEESESGELVEVTAKPLAKSEAKEPAERTDDPVRMYLREMGSVELLSREGEIAIAKRIEAGREAMIAGLCESPLTFQAVIIWRDELNEGKVFLRDIIDLEATYAGPDAKAPAALPAIRMPPATARAPGAPGFPGQPVQAPPSAPLAATPFKPMGGNMGGGTPGAAPANNAGGAAAGEGEDRRGSRDRRQRYGRGRSREFDVARRDRGRAEAESARDLRQDRRRLQAAAPSAGLRTSSGKLKNETLSPAQERKYRRSSRKRSSRR